MHMKTYLTESARTASPVFETSDVPAHNLAGVLEVIARSIEPLDQIKKALFYRRPIDESKFDNVTRQPGFFDHLDTAEYEGLEVDILHAVVGIITEAGELAEALLSALNFGAFDYTNLKEESGDQLWYLAMLFRSLGTDFETEAKRNIDKLKARFPDKFTVDEAINRDTLAELEVLKT